MAIPYTQDWSAGNSVFTSMNFYQRDVNGPDALYPDINIAGNVTIAGGQLDWNTTNGDYQTSGIWLRGMGSLTGGGLGIYSGSGFWDASVGYLEGTYTPNATSLANVTFAPLMAITNPASSETLAIAWDATNQYEVNRTTESGQTFTNFSGTAPTAGVPLTVKLCWQCGTFNGTDHDADGYVRVFLNGGLAYEETNIALYLTYFTEPNNLADSATFGFDGLIGSLDNLTVSDVSCVATSASATPSASGPEEEPDIPDNDSVHCCGATIDPTTGETSSGGIPESLQPWIQNCVGGGIVQTAPDIEDTESWDL